MGLKITGKFRQIGIEEVSFYKDSEGKDIIFDGGIFELNMTRNINDRA